MKIIEALKSKNRALLEMFIGILFYGLILQIVGSFLVDNQWYYARGLWFGIAMACVSTLHMYRSLDRALDYGADASKLITRDYLIRYVLIAVILLIIMVTEVMNPLVVFMAYMGLKVAAYLQPFTHKICNRMFHETDPIPQSLEELEEAKEGEKPSCDLQ